MVSVALPVAEVEELIAGSTLGVAAVNGPAATVVAGDPATCAELVAVCDERNIRARRVEVDYASHSAQVDGLRDELIEALASIAPTGGVVSFVSTVGEAARVDTTSLGAGYWFENLRRRVDFAGAVRLLREQGHSIFVEVSPHPVLVPGLPDDTIGVGSLRRDDGGADRFLTSLGEAWAHGVTVDWTAVFAGQDAQRIVLPTYPFQHRRYWLDAPAVASDDAATGLGLASTNHPLWGAAVSLADGQGVLFTARLSRRSHPWLVDHAVRDTTLLPGTALLELLFRAGEQVGCGRVEELTMPVPVLLPERGAVSLQLVVGAPDTAGRRTATLYARPADGDDTEWTEHASGMLAPGNGAGLPGVDLSVWPPTGAVPVPLDGFYQRLAGVGFHYGPVFQGLRAVWRRGDELFADVRLPELAGADPAGYGLHPALLDAALQAMGFGAFVEGDAQVLPFAWSGVSLLATGAPALRVRITSAGPAAIALEAADLAGQPVATIGSLALR
ncbi:MAG TPA: acyltransferase domain-containing protein, partial [Micromonospora sp.]